MKEYRRLIAVNKKTGKEFIAVDAHVVALFGTLKDLRVIDPSTLIVYQVEEDELKEWEVQEEKEGANE